LPEVREQTDLGGDTRQLSIPHVWMLQLQSASLLEARQSTGLAAAVQIMLRLLYSSRFSFRRPQCFSFDGLYSGIAFAPCSASNISDVTRISGPRSSAAIRAPRSRPGIPDFAASPWASFMMYAAASFKVVRVLLFGGTIGLSKGRVQGHLEATNKSGRVALV
jgi:hypothetical protein